MGFDVSWHPISQKEMHRWYFDRLPEVRAGQDSGVAAVLLEYAPGREAGNEDFCRKGYREILVQGAKTGPHDSFAKTHAFFLAAVQGMFRTFYYTRGGAFSFLLEEYPEMAAYTLPFERIVGDAFPNPKENCIIENYCGGVYIPEEQIPRLAADYMSGKIKPQLEQCFGETLPVFLKALGHAGKEKLGLLEATEVVEPNPLNLHATTCCSYLLNCDFDGVMLYANTAKRQLEEAVNRDAQANQVAREARRMDRQAPPPASVHPDPAPAPETPPPPESKAPPQKEEPAPKKKGFFGRLFGGKG